MNFRRLLGALALCALVDASVFAAGIPVVNLSPSELTIPATATILVTAKVLPDTVHPLISKSITLLETDDRGNTLAILGQMYDDGSRGDTTAGDLTYSFQIVVSQAAPNIRFFRVTAAYSGLRNRVLSEVSRLMVTPELSQVAVDAASASFQRLQSSFDSNVAVLGVAGATALVVSQAIADPSIGPGSVSLDVDSDVVAVDYNVVDPATGFTMKIGGLILVDDPTTRGQTDGAGGSWPPSFPSDYQSPSNDKVLIYAPGYSAPAPHRQNQVADQALSAFDFAEFMTFKPAPLRITMDAAASLENIKTWGNFSTIIVHTHGRAVKLPGFTTAQVALLTGTSISEKSGTILKDLIAGRIRKVPALGRYAILPSYIRAYVTDLPQSSFIYLGACQSAKSNSLIKALLDAGAGAVVGWSETVNRGFNASYAGALLEKMLPFSPATPPMSAQQAFASTPGYDSVGPKGAQAVLTYANKGGNFTYALQPLRLTVTGTSAFALPASINLSSIYLVPVSNFQVAGDAGNNCLATGGERGGPIFSASVPPGADFYGVSTVGGFPTPPAFPAVNRRPCSSFIATTTDADGNAKVWVNATARGFGISGGFTYDWEYQIRYFSGSPPTYSDKRCTIGTVPNSGNFSAAGPVTCSVSCNGALFGKLPINAPGPACTAR